MISTYYSCTKTKKSQLIGKWKLTSCSCDNIALPQNCELIDLNTVFSFTDSVLCIIKNKRDTCFKGNYSYDSYNKTLYLYYNSFVLKFSSVSISKKTMSLKSFFTSLEYHTIKEHLTSIEKGNTLNFQKVK